MTTLDGMRAHLETHNWPRLHCTLIVALACSAAFLSSYLLLSFGVSSMAIRYGEAALVGYLAFVMLIRAWVSWKQRELRSDIDESFVDAVTTVDWSPGVPRGAADPPAFGGGDGLGVALDLGAEDLAWLLIVAAAGLAGIAAIAYVVYLAPVLLAELVLDVAVAAGVYKGLQGHESAHWTRNVLRRTAIPAAIVIVFAAAAGYALQRLAPDAQSIGGVWAQLRN